MRRQHDGGLELTRQISGAVKWLRLTHFTGQLLAVEPNLVVSPRMRQQVFRQATSIGVNFGVNRALGRVDAGHDIAVHVTASGDAVNGHAVHGHERVT